MKVTCTVNKNTDSDMEVADSGYFEEILQIHKHRAEQSRVIHHWTGVVPCSEDWEVELGVAEVVACSIPAFFHRHNLQVHAVRGLDDAGPSFRSVLALGSSIRAPREAVYFAESQEKGERLVLAVDTDRCGDVRISVYSTNAAYWVAVLREHAFQENHLRGQVFDLEGSLVQVGNVALEDVILTNRQSTLVLRHIIGYMRNIEVLMSRGARGQRGILFEGVPGCGKSMLLRAIANELSGISICIAGPDQICRHNSIAVLKQLIEMTSPCLVFIEEIDIFGVDRRRGGGPGMAELMQIMDGLKNVSGILWIGTTNRPGVVESALADRPGRFDRRLEFGPLPDAERCSLIERVIQPQLLTEEALDLAVLATKNMTGAQVHELAESLRILSSNKVFGVSDVQGGLEDCGFLPDNPFGFASQFTR